MDTDTLENKSHSGVVFARFAPLRVKSRSIQRQRGLSSASLSVTVHIFSLVCLRLATSWRGRAIWHLNWQSLLDIPVKMTREQTSVRIDAQRGTRFYSWVAGWDSSWRLPQSEGCFPVRADVMTPLFEWTNSLFWNVKPPRPRAQDSDLSQNNGGWVWVGEGETRERWNTHLEFGKHPLMETFTCHPVNHPSWMAVCGVLKS